MRTSQSQIWTRRVLWLASLLASATVLPATGSASPKPRVLAALARPSSGVETFQGEARDESGRVVYRERHEITRVDGRRTKSVTYYYNPKRELVAKLVNTYDKDPYAPDYQFVDYRTKQREGTELRGRRLVLVRGGDRKAVPFVSSGDDRMTSGQGLDHMIRNRLDDLANGKSFTVAYAFPSRFDTFAFRLGAVKAPRPGVARVRIDLDSWFLRLFAPYLEADYDRATGRLISYRGVSNLKNADGENEMVTIRYRYPSGS